jgi:hypothetical protein
LQQIFHDQNITGVQIIRIDPSDDYPVKLSNGDSLQASDEIRLHKPEDEKSKWKHPYEIRYIEDFTLIKGEDKSIKVSVHCNFFVIKGLSLSIVILQTCFISFHQSFETLLKQHAISGTQESSPETYTEAIPCANISSSGRKRRSCA